MEMISGASARVWWMWRALAAIRLICLIGLMLALAGCGVTLPPAWTSQRLPPLRVSHLQRLAGLSNLEGYSFPFYSAIPFQQSGGAMQALLVNATTIAVARLDGAGLRVIAQTPECDPWAAVSPDGQWVVCAGYDASGVPGGYRRNQIQAFALTPRVSPQRWQTDLDAQSDYAYPAWSPNGAYLALTRRSSAGCAVTIYAVDALAHGAGADTPLTTLTSPAIQNATGECAVTGMGWSPDGARLLLATRKTASCPAGNISTPIAQTLRQNVRSVVVPAIAFIPACGSAFTGSPDIPEVFWNPRGDDIATDTGGGGFALESSWGAQRVQAVGFSDDTLYHVWSMAWTPDGRGLLLVVGPPQCTDRCSPHYLLDAYLYTLPTTTPSR